MQRPTPALMIQATGSNAGSPYCVGTMERGLGRARHGIKLAPCGNEAVDAPFGCCGGQGHRLHNLAGGACHICQRLPRA